MPVKINSMTLQDLPAILEIEQKSFSDPWSRRSFISELTENPYAVYFVAIYKEKIAGYIGGWLITDELHITNLAVSLNCRNVGIAQALIDEIIKYSAEKDVKRATLEVRVTNNPAINLYRKKGFIAVGHRPKYYTNNNEDALIMWKEYNSGSENKWASK